MGQGQLTIIGGSTMELQVDINYRSNELCEILLTGSLDTDTASQLEEKLETVFDSASKELMLADSDIGKKVYEIEQEITLVVKTQVVAKNRDEAFDKWLNETVELNYHYSIYQKYCKNYSCQNLRDHCI